MSWHFGRTLVWLACLGLAANLLAASIVHVEASLDEPSSDSRAHLPNYRDVDWADTQFPALEDSFLDLRRAFDRDQYIYIDADHAGPNGNAIIAAAIGAFLNR